MSLYRYGGIKIVKVISVYREDIYISNFIIQLMDKNAIRRYLLDFFGRPFPPMYPRDYTIPETKRINVLIGSRRVGKTFLLYQMMYNIIGQKKEKGKEMGEERILYLNFEHPLLFKKIRYDEIHLLLEIYWSLFPPQDAGSKIPLSIFIDEPQAMENWEIAIRSLNDDFNFSLYITGSSSKLLSKEISTILRGRTITTHVLPLSFKEFLRFKEKEVKIQRLNTMLKANLLFQLNEYLLYGGYPEVVEQQDPTIKLRILRDLLDLTIYRDLIQRFSIRNVDIIKHLIDFLVSNASNQMSVNKMFNHFISQGYSINKSKFYEYISMLTDISFIHVLKKFSTSVRTTNASAPKYFLNDPGFFSLYSIDSAPRQLELHVFLHILRICNQNNSIKVYYWKSKEDWEVDFLLIKGRTPIQAIQVTHSMNNPTTKEREFRSLVRCKEVFPKVKPLLITYDTEGSEMMGGIEIPIIPFWKWVLSPDENETS